MKEIFAYIDEHRDEFVKKLQRFCQQPSISAQKKGMKETFRMVRGFFEEADCEIDVLSSDNGEPALFAKKEGAFKKCLLFYNHYDVQPPEPLSDWHYPPFGCEQHDGKLYARGTSDNKGDIIARLSALEAFLKIKGELPLTVKFFIEGEEEIGSPNIASLVSANRGKLSADACIWEFGQKSFDGAPMIFLGVKGLCYVELEVKSAKSDLHSSKATTIPNPAWRLIWALNSLKNEKEEVLIDGFYDKVVPLSSDERKAISRIPDEGDRIKSEIGIKNFLLGLSGTERIERDLTAPTCTICGVYSGYTGEGPKTVLPSVARAKIGFRLVPEQKPQDIFEKLKAHFVRSGFPDVKAHLIHKEPPHKTPLTAEISRVVALTAGEIYEKEPVIYPNTPATGPMHSLCGELGIPVVSIGVANAASRMHGPDENIAVDDFICGIKHIALIMHRFSENSFLTDVLSDG